MVQVRVCVRPVLGVGVMIGKSRVYDFYLCSP